MSIPPLFSTAYLPPLSYLAILAQNGRGVVEAHENYVKQSYRNRCHIITANGKLSLSIPIRHQGGLKIPIRELRTDERQAWRRVHWRAITSAYSGSPFFLYYADELRDLILGGPDLVYDLNMGLLLWLLDSLNIPAELTESVSYTELGAAQDYRSLIHPKRPVMTMPPYYQVFADRHGFMEDLSAIDLLFNLGPESKEYLLALPPVTPGR